MNNETIEVEVISEETTTQNVPTELSVIIEQSNLPMESTSKITATFTPYLAKISDFSKKLQPLLDKMATGAEPDKDDVKLAGLIRKAIKANRMDATHEKKDVKDNIIKEGRFIDNIFKTIESGCDLLETKAKQIEDYHAIKEKKRLDTLEAERRELLRECYGEIETSYVNVRDMPEQAWEDYKDSLDATLKSRKEAEAARITKEEADRKAAEEMAKVQAEERKRIEEENAKLKAEKEAKEKADAEAETKRKIEAEKAEKEKARLQAEAEAAKREAEEAAQKAAKAIEDARKEAEAKEAKRLKDEADAKAAAEQAKKDAEEAAKKADDKVKLQVFISQLESVTYPEMKSDANKALIELAKERIDKIVAHLKTI